MAAEPDGDKGAGDGGEDWALRQARKTDVADAKETVDRVRREGRFHKALWGYRVYYTGLFSCLGSLIVAIFDGAGGPMAVVPVAFPVAIAGQVYGIMQLRAEFREYMAAANSEVPHSRRDRRNLWQSAILRDTFMGRTD